MKSPLSLPRALVAGLLIAAGGCVEPASPPASDAAATAKKDSHGHDHAGHDHAMSGPHSGLLIELGNEAYHAELVRDEAQGVAIYILNSQAREAVPIDAAEVRVNLRHAGKGTQFLLTSAPQSADPPGKSSRFVSRDAELARQLDLAGVQARLALDIEGKAYSGAIPRPGEHGNHNH